MPISVKISFETVRGIVANRCPFQTVHVQIGGQTEIDPVVGRGAVVHFLGKPGQMLWDFNEVRVGLGAAALRPGGIRAVPAL